MEKQKYYNLYGITYKVFPECKEGEVIVGNEDAIAEELNKGCSLPEAFNKTRRYHGKIISMKKTK
jgi:hypothetical protein